jgi:hypothetical protein
MTMIAYYRPKQNAEDTDAPPPKRKALSNELFHGLSPEDFDSEAQTLADMKGMTSTVRARLKAQLVERLKTPVDEPSWGPDWVRHGEKVAAQRHTKSGGVLSKLIPFAKRKDEEAEAAPADPLNEEERDDANVIARNMEKSRQVAHYRPLYLVAVGLALAIALLAMFVDYQIIRGDVWTRALSNEFMVVPASLQSSVIFKSMQVIFAVLIVHFMLKITGAYGRNTLITAAFLMALVMIGCLGYLVAYNNMSGATSATLEHGTQTAMLPQANAIDQLFSSPTPVKTGDAADVAAPRLTNASMTDGVGLGLPKLSQTSLANADSWFWLAFASVIFFIVTTVAALYMQTVENNVRNAHIAHDYKHRQRQFAQLHLLELADRKQS